MTGVTGVNTTLRFGHNDVEAGEDGVCGIALYPQRIAKDLLLNPLVCRAGALGGGSMRYHAVATVEVRCRVPYA